MYWITVEARKLERDRPPIPNRRTKENRRTSSYVHVPTFGCCGSPYSGHTVRITDLDPRNGHCMPNEMRINFPHEGFLEEGAKHKLRTYCDPHYGNSQKLPSFWKPPYFVSMLPSGMHSLTLNPQPAQLNSKANFPRKPKALVGIWQVMGI